MSFTQCPCSVHAGSVGGTLTGGIQNLAPLIPLLGTGQCEDHASSALTKGYLYVAATPMSLFGSLGLARAGFKTFIASLDFSIFNWNVRGALMLSNMGFRPVGTNLSLIMLDENNKDKHHLVETRLDELLEDLHVDETKITGVLHNSKRWNVEMMVYTGFCCLLSVIPYIYLNFRSGSSLSYVTRWTFPAIRSVGGFLTATMTQLIIQRRITTLCRRWLSKHDHGKNCDPPSERARRISEMDVPESDNRSGGPGRARDSDLERGLEQTGSSHKDEIVSVANIAPDCKSEVPITATDRSPKTSPDHNHGQTTDQDRNAGSQGSGRSNRGPDTTGTSGVTMYGRPDH
jgi:hypothetical protein